MHYIEVYFCQQSEFGDSADSSNRYNVALFSRLYGIKYILNKDKQQNNVFDFC